ncbi:dihydroneopterin aldolase [Microbacterium terricola]|uniref:dihydroneopterin aldolase n=1 Tax=Microbacterium terricola TaxID=344163 RepID=UPI0021E87C6B|nr:dihydroneopterin aldolase [Microbacterium terricola]UYK41636.1 dihydroneopterin aldolase [Microbacterium terricola]
MSLTGLRAFGRHGVFAHERENGQQFTVDLVLSVDAAPAASSDDVADTVHYGEVADAVAAIIEGEPVNLIETLATRIADAVLAFAGVRAVQVTVHKPQAPIAHEFADVAVTITRPRAGA